MKKKGSNFKNRLSLLLPIAVVSIAMPITLTSCSIFDTSAKDPTKDNNKPDDNTSGGDSDSSGSGDSSSSGGDSSSGGGSSGSGNENKPEVVKASWDSSKLNNITFDSKLNIPIITLGSSSFNNTGLTKLSKLSDIEKSLNPITKSSPNTQDNQVNNNGIASLFSLLSPAITNIEKFDVTLSINPNDVSFDYTNDNVANTINGEFILAPKTSLNGTDNSTNQTLGFKINNFNDSNNVDSNGKSLSWNTTAIANALASSNTATGNKLPDATPKDNGASVTITIPNNNGLGKVMDSLSNTRISSTELKPFINGIDQTDFDFSKVIISNWAPSVDGSMFFTRIVIPSKTNTVNNKEAVLYMVYNGFSNDDGNGAWNRNIPYFNATNIDENLWDSIYKDPVIDLTKIKGDICGITSSSKVSDIESKQNDILNYVAQNYILGFNKLTISDKNKSFNVGSFDSNGNFVKNKNGKVSSQSNDLKNNNNVIMIQFVVKPNDKTSAQINPNTSGIYKSLYIIGYSV